MNSLKKYCNLTFDLTVIHGFKECDADGHEIIRKKKWFADEQMPNLI